MLKYNVKYIFLHMHKKSKPNIKLKFQTLLMFANKLNWKDSIVWKTHLLNCFILNDYMHTNSLLHPDCLCFCLFNVCYLFVEKFANEKLLEKTRFNPSENIYNFALIYLSLNFFGNYKDLKINRNKFC